MTKALKVTVTTESGEVDEINLWVDGIGHPHDEFEGEFEPGSHCRLEYVLTGQKDTSVVFELDNAHPEIFYADFSSGKESIMGFEDIRIAEDNEDD